MGGIGTGNFSIGSRGQLCDWELCNTPAVGAQFSYSFFAIRTEDTSHKIRVRILESRLKPPHDRANGYESALSAGIPRFETARMAGEVSCAMVELRDSHMPVDVDLFAFSPFIPLNPDDSGIPGAVLRYRVRNTSGEHLSVSLAGSLGNGVGYVEQGRFGAMVTQGQPENTYRESVAAKGIFMTNPKLPAEHLLAGSMALLTTSTETVTVKPCWVKSSWWDGAHDFWDEFLNCGSLWQTPPEADHITTPSFEASHLRIGSICSSFSLEPGEEKEVEFLLTWYFPNRPHRWPGQTFCDPDDGRITQNYYASRFQDAWDVGHYLQCNMERLEHDTEQFRSALYQTTLPPVMLDAMAANISVLRSSTCFRIADGTFLGWEGTFDDAGSCEGNCSHVWAYQQTLAFLFPMLERDMRRVNFLLETGEAGDTAYRSNMVFGYERFTDIPPAADGQMATLVQLYRDWKLSGDDFFLKRMWPKAKKALNYAFTAWDLDGDYVFDAEQHNTFDIEFYGMSSYTSALFYAALRAGEEIASYLGERECAQYYRYARETGARKMDAALFNGEYYVQKCLDGIPRRYQYGEGCLANQLFGQTLAHIAGLGYILPEEHVKSAIMAVYRNNFLPSMEEHINVQRVYALNDEAGLICCSWPNGEKPAIPFVYSDEVWTGFEYQTATHLIYEGFFEEALTLVKAVRNRYDGVRRNPWSEVELGNHYVRAMASWGLLIASSGFRYDLTKEEISFAPVISQKNFTCFFSTGSCWGLYSQREDPESGELRQSLDVLYGEADGLRLKHG